MKNLKKRKDSFHKIYIKKGSTNVEPFFMN